MVCLILLKSLEKNNMIFAIITIITAGVVIYLAPVEAECEDKSDSREFAMVHPRDRFMLEYFYDNGSWSIECVTTKKRFNRRNKIADGLSANQVVELTKGLFVAREPGVRREMQLQDVEGFDLSFVDKLKGKLGMVE